jgi:hypothetical protein
MIDYSAILALFPSARPLLQGGNARKSQQTPKFHAFFAIFSHFAWKNCGLRGIDKGDELHKYFHLNVLGHCPFCEMFTGISNAEICKR